MIFYPASSLELQVRNRAANDFQYSYEEPKLIVEIVAFLNVLRGLIFLIYYSMGLLGYLSSDTRQEHYQP